jgi:hypothetical protein
VFKDGWTQSFPAGTRLRREKDGRWWVMYANGEARRLAEDPDDVPVEVYAI